MTKKSTLAIVITVGSAIAASGADAAMLIEQPHSYATTVASTKVNGVTLNPGGTTTSTGTSSGSSQPQPVPVHGVVYNPNPKPVHGVIRKPE